MNSIDPLIPAQTSSRFSEDTVWHRRAAALIGTVLILRIAYLAWFPLDLVHDEAYYWDWSRNLDWGYYSKPPMIAWLIAASTSLFGSTPFAVRLPATLLGTAGLVFLYLLATRMYHGRVGFWTVVVSAATPGNAAMGLIMTIDAPLLFFWTAGLYALWRMLERRADRPAWLLAVIVATGLGLLSKQTMVGLLAGGGLFLLLSAADRHELRRPAVWLWGLGSLLFLTPVLWWNVRHGWITLQHTGEHFVAEPVTLARRLIRSAEFLGTQAGVVTPLTWGLLVAVLIAAAWVFRKLPRRERFLLCFSGVPLLAVVALSLKQRVEPNWPAACYVAAMILAVAWLDGQITVAPWLGGRRRWLHAAAGLGVCCTLLVYLLPVVLDSANLEGTKIDPVVRLRGWRKLGAAVGGQLATAPRPDATFVWVATGRTETSELAFYLPGQPKVYLWADGPIRSQYQIWGGPQGKHGWDAVIVTHPRQPVPADVADHFSAVRPFGDIDVAVGNGRRLTYQLWRGERFASPPVHISSQPADSHRR